MLSKKQCKFRFRNVNKFFSATTTSRKYLDAVAINYHSFWFCLKSTLPGYFSA